MNIETTKLELMQLLLKTQKESILVKLKKVFEDEKADWWDELSTEEQQEIQAGITQADDGKLTSHNDVMKIFEKWS